MAKRYSDQTPSLIQRTRVSNPNLGRVDASPILNLTNTIKKEADNARREHVQLAKEKAIREGFKAGKEVEITYDNKGVPQYEAPELGGIFYQNAFEDASRLVYERATQDKLVEKIDKDYLEWGKDPSNINDMDLLEKKLRMSAEAFINELPQGDQALAINQMNNRVSGILKNEYTKKVSRAFNQKVAEVSTLIDSLINETPEIDLDSDEGTEHTKKLNEALGILTKLNGGDNALAAIHLKAYQDKIAYVKVSSDVIFARNSLGELMNGPHLPKLAEIINTGSGNLTLKNKKGVDVTIDGKWVRDNFPNDNDKTAMLSRINRIVTNNTQDANNNKSASLIIEDVITDLNED